jgi:predicted transcriptional regulator
MLNELFASKTQAKLIEMFFRNPNRKFYQREIGKTVNESLGSIQYELKRLERLGIIKSENNHTKKYYFPNRDFYLYSELRDIIFKTVQKNLT